MTTSVDTLDELYQQLGKLMAEFYNDPPDGCQEFEVLIVERRRVEDMFDLVLQLMRERNPNSDDEGF